MSSQCDQFLTLHEHFFEEENQIDDNEGNEENSNKSWRKIDTKSIWLPQIKEIEEYGSYLTNLSKTESIQTQHIKQLHSYFHNLLRADKHYEPLLFLQIMLLAKVQAQVLSLIDPGNLELLSDWDLYFTENQRLQQQFQQLVMIFLFRLPSTETRRKVFPFEHKAYRSFLHYLYDLLGRIGQENFEEIGVSFQTNHMFSRMMR